MIRTLLLFLTLLPLGSFAQHDKATIQANGTIMREAQRDVMRLADDKMEGRETGTPGEIMAAEYIVQRFQQVGLQPKGEQDWYQHFEGTPTVNPHAAEQPKEVKPIPGRNVVGWIDNGAASTVIIGAHYDHLGWGGEGSLHAGEKQIHNGADDNASGVAVMIQLARNLKGKYTHNNYVFIAFSGEEKGLWGSNWYSKHPTVPIESVNYMINMDMVGRLDSNKLAVNGVGTSPVWKPTLEPLARERVTLVMGESGTGPSDHTSFYNQGVPVLHFFTGQHSDYHKPGDDARKVNYRGMVTVTNFIYDLIGQLDSAPKLAFTKTKSDEKDVPAFKVTLGVMPDYMYTGEGFRIDGVTEEKPAAIAGLQAGDIVLKLGDVDVTDIYSYMEGLSKFEKGDHTTVKIKRGGETKEFPIQF